MKDTKENIDQSNILGSMNTLDEDLWLQFPDSPDNYTPSKKLIFGLDPSPQKKTLQSSPDKELDCFDGIDNGYFTINNIPFRNPDSIIWEEDQKMQVFKRQMRIQWEPSSSLPTIYEENANCFDESLNTTNLSIDDSRTMNDFEQYEMLSKEGQIDKYHDDEWL